MFVSPATTGVQAASVVFYTTAVSLNCSFAAGSSASTSGCLFVFQLTNQNRSENVTVPYKADGVMMFNTSCDQLSNTRCNTAPLTVISFTANCHVIHCLLSTEGHMMRRFWCMLCSQTARLSLSHSLPLFWWRRSQTTSPVLCQVCI